jgi:hypothetical protein
LPQTRRRTKEELFQISKSLICSQSSRRIDNDGRSDEAASLVKQKLADEFSIDITVCHFPPGTSKWNKIEHRLFSYISKNWRGRPLVDMATVVNLIANNQNGNRIDGTLCRRQESLPDENQSRR